MAVHIRLRRTGTTRKPAYRVVVADSRAARDGKFIEVLGHYNPLTNPPTIKIEVEKASQGPSGRVVFQLPRAGVAAAPGMLVRIAVAA